MPASDWVPIEEAAPEIGVHVETLRVWHRKKFCPVLGKKARFSETDGDLCIHQKDKTTIQLRLSEAVSDEWNPIYSVALELNIPAPTIRRWGRVENCAPLGKSVRIERKWKPDSANRYRNLLCIHRDDAESLRQLAATDDPTWIPVEEAAPEIGVSVFSLIRWNRKGFCPPVGKKVRFKRRNGYFRHRVYTRLCIHRDDKKLIEAAVSNEKEDEEWIPITECPSKIGRAVDTVRHWHQRDYCPPLGRKAKIEKRHTKDSIGRHQSVLCIHKDDIDEINTAATTSVSQWIPLTEAADGIGVDRKTLWNYSKYCPRLGRAARIRNRRMRDPAGAMRDQSCIYREDYEALGGESLPAAEKPAAADPPAETDDPADNGKTPPDDPPTRDETAYRPMSELWHEKDRFSSSGACSRFLDTHKDEIDSHKPSKRRRMVHVGQWYAYWAKHDEGEFKRLDNEPSEAEKDAIKRRTEDANKRRTISERSRLKPPG